MRQLFFSIFLSVLLCACSNNILKVPLKEIGEISQREKVLIRTGIEYHDNQNFDAAVKLYNKALDINPTNIYALYELSYSYRAMGNTQKCYDTAEKGLNFKSELIPHFYMTMANCLDEMNKPGEALDLYEAAIEKYPDMQMLYFNMGVTLAILDKTNEAKIAFEKSAILEPSHPGTHYNLGKIYFLNGEKAPALLAFSRFLILEPFSERSREVFEISQYILNSFINIDNNNEVVISLPKGYSKDNDPMLGLEVSLSIHNISKFIQETKSKQMTNKESFDSVLSPYLQFLVSVSELKKPEKSEHFASKYYAPYFKELANAQFKDIYTRLMTVYRKDDSSMDWLRSRQTSVEKFYSWNEQYNWPNL